jgi:hypothetical protein
MVNTDVDSCVLRDLTILSHREASLANLRRMKASTATQTNQHGVDDLLTAKIRKIGSQLDRGRHELEGYKDDELPPKHARVKETDLRSQLFASEREKVAAAVKNAPNEVSRRLLQARLKSLEL